MFIGILTAFLQIKHADGHTRTSHFVYTNVRYTHFFEMQFCDWLTSLAMIFVYIT